MPEFRLCITIQTILKKGFSSRNPTIVLQFKYTAAFETLHYMRTHSSGKTGFMALKLDMSKAYDRVRLNFLEFMMYRIGFCEVWVKLIMLCVSSVRYTSIGECTGTGLIIPSRGLR